MISDVNRIIVEVARKHGILTEDIFSPSRSKSLVLARHEAMRRARQETQCSYPELARIFRRDTSSIVHACRKIPKS